MISPEIANLTQAADGGSPATLQVDIIADFVCPWSFLGKRRLDDALAAVHGPSRVTWYPFQINPAMPDGGVTLDDYLREKFGDPNAVQKGIAALVAAGRKEGIEYRLDRIERVPNTLNTHRLLHLAENSDVDATALADSIYRAFFEQGLNIGETDVLLALAEAAGLDRKAVLQLLDDDASKRFVLAQESQVRQNGVTGVPDFLVNQRLFVVGAQSTENMVKVFDRVMFGEESDLELSSTLH